MMKKAAFIPIKSNSERVPGKNFRVVGGKPLYQYIMHNAVASGSFDRVYVDSDSQEVLDFGTDIGIYPLERVPELALPTANGNDLAVHWANRCPGHDIYFNLFATAPLLSPESIAAAAAIMDDPEYDSVLTVTEQRGWFWYKGASVGQNPHLPTRTQDQAPMLKETTGLYGIRREALLRYHCRSGAHPCLMVVPPEEAVDLDNESDFEHLEYLIQRKHADRSSDQ
jgi:CMP-N-acetylneuraminic acid synthetase